MAPPLFILSFRHRDELSRISERGGWQPLAARRAEQAEARFLASGAAIALVDARGALEEGIEAVRAIADAAEANAASLLVLLSRNDSEALETMYRLGATHFLVSPFSDSQLLHALQFALRHAERAGGEITGRRSDEANAASWAWQPGSPSVELSPALARQAGLGEHEGRRIGLIELFRRLDPEGRRAARSAIERALATGEATAFAHTDSDNSDARIAHHVRVQDAGLIVGRTESIGRKANGRRGRDPLTGLSDGRAVRAWLAEHLGGEAGNERGAETGGIVLLLVSVSRYDAINAAFGRQVGDAVLQAAARRVERQAEPDGKRILVARLAGAEFAVLLASPATAADGRYLAGELIDAISRPFLSGDHVITLASRAGVAVSRPGDDAAALLRRASVALAEARDSERSLVGVVEEGEESETARAERLAVDLRRALDRNEIEIRFQPQVTIASNEIAGVEALARWVHPELGELGAATLFSVAERSDYLAQLSDHIQRRALAAANAWPDALSHLRLSLNVTATDMLRDDFASHFMELVESSGFPRERLTVEVTESGLIEDLGGAASLLAQLRTHGLRSAIDDFGTGYSSLAYLKALPLDYLKIDRRLSQDIVGSTRDRIVVRGVIDMARSLGLDVVAEGVEMEDQLALLAGEGCTYYQGFLCAPPLGVNELVQLVMSGKRSP
jgi:diguanylate cyclase (GGDEF)-like protein